MRLNSKKHGDGGEMSNSEALRFIFGFILMGLALILNGCEREAYSKDTPDSTFTTRFEALRNGLVYGDPSNAPQWGLMAGDGQAETITCERVSVVKSIYKVTGHGTIVFVRTESK